jgi:hypothetical protein
MTRLVLDPYIPLALWVPLALAAGGLLAWYGAASRKRLPGPRWGIVIALMTIAAIVPLAILLNPTWLERLPAPAGKPLLTVLVDRSASMATRDVRPSTSRYEAACRTAREVAQRLSDRYEVRLRAFAGESVPTAPDQLAAIAADGPTTDLAAAIEEALDPDRPQGQAVLLVSDGGHNAGGGAARVLESATKAKAMAAPVYVKTLGGQGEVRDLEVALRAPQELAFVGQPTSVVVRLRQRGRLAERASLSLVHENRQIDSLEAPLKPDGATEATFTVSQPAAGLFRY